MKYNSLRLERFKSFIDLNIPLRKLTLLTGLNNSGKSSVLQALRMLSKFCIQNSPVLEEHGYLHELKNMNKQEPSFVITLNGEDFLKLSVHTLKGEQSQCNIEGDLKLKSSYLSADRLGPSSNLPINMYDVLDNVGVRGEYVIDFLERYGSLKIDERLKHPKSKGSTLNYNLEGWLSEIAPRVEFDKKVDQLHSYSFSEFNKFRSTNTGFGLSYTLPVLVSALGMNAIGMPMMMLENPEAHLHPKGQTEMGKLLALAANVGTQIVVETHSDHIIDGVRIAIIEGKLSPDECNILFFSLNQHNETEMQVINVDTQGKLSKWPEGFFDQNIINKSIIAGRG